VQDSSKWAARVAGVLAVAMFAFAAVVAEASRVTPMIVEIKPTGRDSVARVELTNDADRDIPYEVEMMSGEISPEGSLSLVSADEQFIVFPPQALIEANTQQVFRIQYVGEDALDQSQIYYLSIKQIPVAFEEGQNQVQVVVNYNVLVNVVPDGTSPLAVVRSASYVERAVPTEEEADGNAPAADTPGDETADETPMKKGILVDLGNDGNRYFFAGQSDWSITALTATGEPFEQSYTGEEMSRLIGPGVVGPGKNRIFFLPTEKELAKDTLRITVDP
jgi:fimbrial chaperone protein